jgi:hypothetical protein
LAATALGDVCCAQDKGEDTTGLMMAVVLSLPEALRRGTQNDTSELARVLFTQTGLGDAAQILLLQNMTCSCCDGVSVTADWQTGPELKLLKDDVGTVGLPDLIDRFFTPEIISGYTACDGHCITEQSATMHLSVASISETLLLFINRNIYNAETEENEKLMQHVHCPATLSLVVDGEPTELSLVATSYHRGATVSSGHYFTVGWNSNGTATLFDDATVRSFTAAEAKRFDEEHQVVSASYSLEAHASELDGLRLQDTTYAPVPPAGTTPVRRIHVCNRVQRDECECCDGGDLDGRVAAEAEAAEAEAGAEAEAEAEAAAAAEAGATCDVEA